MLHLVEVASESGDLLTFPLTQPASGLILTGMDGLDPGKATLVASDYAQQDGQKFHNARRGSRNILMGITLDPRFGGGSVRELRKQLYQVFMPKSKVDLTFHLEGSIQYKISGVVESLDAPTFGQKPAALVSIICHDPDFYDPTPHVQGAEAYSTLVENLVAYGGDVPAGYQIELQVNGGVTSNGFTVYHRLPNTEVTTLEFSAALQGLDIVQINSTPGEKSATLIRGSTATNIIAGISPSSVWPKMAPGDNYVAVIVTGDQFYYEIQWVDKFGGI